MKLERRKQPRGGFTLIELTIVILIIILLASLLLVAVRGAISTAGVVRQVNDMQLMSQALEGFKAKYGWYPPSRIRLREGTAYNLTEAFDNHSYQWLRRIFGDAFNPVTVRTPAGDPNTAAVANDRRYLWCADVVGKETNRANWTGIYELEGDECLVFFLGGIAQFDRANPTAGIILHGFSRAKGHPDGIPTALVPGSENRDPPLMEFDAKRLVVRTLADGQVQAPPNGALAALTGNNMGAEPTNGYLFPGGLPTQYLAVNAATIRKLPSYLSLGPDKDLQRPWAYFSSYGDGKYRPDDVNFPVTAGEAFFEAVDPTNFPSTVASQRYQCLFLPPTSGANPQYRRTESSFPNPYTETAPWFDTVADPTKVGVPVRFRNPNSYQLISTGVDGKFGSGGQIPRSTGIPDNPPSVTSSDLATNGSAADNITNVSGAQRLGEFNQSQQRGN